MSDGFLIDNSHGVTFASTWHPGPVVRRWLGLGGIKVRMADARQIVACRCERCSFVELYAPEPTPGTTE